MKKLLEDTKYQKHQIRVLIDFLDQEKKFEEAEMFEQMRFVGYVLDISYDKVTIITSDPFKKLVGGIPRNSLLVMIPDSFKELPPHFTLLRVLEAAATPLKQEVQQTYFELQKSSMPELDVFTQSELQWGALKTDVIGMFYPHPDELNKIEFSGDINNYVSAHMYRVYSPNKELLNLIVNNSVDDEHSFPLGKLRLTECRLNHQSCEYSDLDVIISPNDFLATRTAMFGKTRLGKSNIVKLIAQIIIETTNEDRNVGQLIFDINGEYANDNPQDDNLSLASSYNQNCIVYALTQKPDTPSRPLKINFYEYPEVSITILARLIRSTRGNLSNYINNFVNCNIPSLEVLSDEQLDYNVRRRSKRRILLYWALLHKAGFEIDQNALLQLMREHSRVRGAPLDPEYRQELRDAMYSQTPPPIRNLDDLVVEFETLYQFFRNNRTAEELRSANGNLLVTNDDESILYMLDPPTGSGYRILPPYREYHDQNAGEFIQEITSLLENGMTVIIDLGNAPPEIMNFYSDQLARSLFNNQVYKFSRNELGNHFIQLYFEEAHNLFPYQDDTQKDIYRRIAKEGAKYHIGMVYSTQSVTTINQDLLAQTENFFIAHLSSKSEVNRLANVNSAFDGLQDDILRSRTVGFVRILTRSHRFVIPVQANRFSLIEPNGDA